ncbi:unnamed protein product [Lepeophtheirus salmonis]|uniref:(salmon louse) hypothetical protein n=1 Tax=Lepeophtheirus salmonis TaxID=72036 RepID=A0A7R8CGZ0_LEPSM|nr:unnamed protein product [Lepeophtheirus salmonis]CAF2780633.1 unnamed protein product [Lepeophtheirus salmonis]
MTNNNGLDAEKKNCSTRFTTKQCLQLHYVKIHNKSKDEIPRIERDVPFTDEAYAGRKETDGSSARLPLPPPPPLPHGSNNNEEEERIKEVLRDDNDSFDGATNAENERIDVGGTEEIDLLLTSTSTANNDKTDHHPSQILSYTVNDIIGHSEDQRSSDDEEEENSFYEFPESTFNLGEAASINRPHQIQVPIPSALPSVQSHFETHYESDNLSHHHQINSSASFFHSFSDFSPYYHHHHHATHHPPPPTFYSYSAFSAVSEETATPSPSTDFANHLYQSHHPAPHHGEMTLQNYYPQSHHQSHHTHHPHRFSTTPGHHHHTIHQTPILLFLLLKLY